MTEIDFALSQDKQTDQIELVGTVLWNKAEKLGSFKLLSLPERNFVYIDIFESELNHGGLFHFFYNTSGEFSHEVLEAFIAIEANDSSNLFDKALRSFPELPVPKDIMVRRQFMNQFDSKITKYWDDIEHQFAHVKEDIVALLIDYIKTHKSEFEY